MGHYKEAIDYKIVIEYEFTQYYLKRRLKELGEKG